MISSMRDLERTWNSKFNYPWTFFNDVEFSEDFRRLTQMETKAKCTYGTLVESVHPPTGTPDANIPYLQRSYRRSTGQFPTG